jgi:hypothetical protein
MDGFLAYVLPLHVREGTDIEGLGYVSIGWLLRGKYIIHMLNGTMFRIYD